VVVLVAQQVDLLHQILLGLQIMELILRLQILQFQSAVVAVAPEIVHKQDLLVGHQVVVEVGYLTLPELKCLVHQGCLVRAMLVEQVWMEVHMAAVEAEVHLLLDPMLQLVVAVTVVQEQLVQ
jgi:hypothetical protein